MIRVNSRRSHGPGAAAASVGLGLSLCAATASAASDLVLGAAGHLAQLIGGLVLIIAVILVLAWLLRRMPGGMGQAQPGIEIVAVRSVGSRERLILVQVGEEQILIGVSPTGIRPLHTMKTPLVLTRDESRTGHFASLLRGSLSGGGA